MSRSTRRQGTVFSALALAFAGVSLFLPRISSRTELWLIAVLIVLLGVPHGALDTLFARREYGVRTPLAWAGFIGAYLALAGAIVWLWTVAPTVFLIGFLAISLAHFSGDPAPGTKLISRIVYGGAPLVLPTLRYANEVQHLFGLLVGPAPAALIVPWLAVVAVPWFGALTACVALEARSGEGTSFEIGAVGVLFMLVPPLIAFTLFFCGMHGARHILRTVTFSAVSDRRFLARAVLLPVLATIMLGAAVWLTVAETSVEGKLLRLLFVGLASLTVPHMVLVEPVRLRGWRAAGE
jgi:beta-carotene 15,15'-dioxygenase